MREPLFRASKAPLEKRKEKLDLHPWEESVAAFVQAQLPDVPSRILDVGCGDGWLTYRLAEVGHDVKGIDPEAPEGPLFHRVALEHFEAPHPFDAIVAVLSLHHIPDLEAAVQSIGQLL